MFKWSKELCNKIKDANCLEPSELQMVEIALRLYECYEEILDENIGLDIRIKKETNFFELEHAVHRNSLKKNQGSDNNVA